MAEHLFLTDLCTICNTTKSKYRCPGCAARTCSLPCYKRHQQWAQCSGKRDPTKYVKKSQLATPAGIDHDFNYLTTIERGLERSERETNEKGLGAASDLRQKSRRGGEPSDSQYAAAGVKIVRAPKGLTRQKENKTHRSSKGNIVWTVEWIREDRSRVLTQSSSSLTIAHNQPFSRPPKKRKLGAAGQQDAQTTPSDGASALTVHKNDEGSKTTTPGRPGAAADDRSPGQHGSKAKTANHDCPGSHIDGNDSESIPPQYHFFLLKPQTSANRHVLVPISSTATLAECLCGRTVLEYPTIYGFAGPSSTLPEGFMLEEEYVKQQGEEQKEFDQLMSSMDPGTLRIMEDELGGSAKLNEEVDSNKILDVLKQDLGTEA